MMCGGEKPPLSTDPVFANSLTLNAAWILTIRINFSAFCTGCGWPCPPVDSLWPNPEWNRDGDGTKRTRIFFP